MWWIIFLYITPGIITTLLLPQYIKCNGGQEYLKTIIEEYEEGYWGYILGFMSFCPILNLLSAVLLILWYVFQIPN